MSSGRPLIIYSSSASLFRMRASHERAKAMLNGVFKLGELAGALIPCLRKDASENLFRVFVAKFGFYFIKKLEMYIKGKEKNLTSLTTMRFSDL